MKQGKEVLVGGVISIGLAVAVIATLWLQGTNWGREVTPVQVWTQEVGQLMLGNDVVFRGVPIGRVASIGVDPGGAFVRVGVEVEGDIALDDDSKAVVAPQSLFGDWQLEIVPSGRYPRFEYYEVPPGFSEGGVRVLGGYTLPDITRLTAAADEISINLAVLTDRFDRAFTEETADALALGIRNVQQMSDDIRDLIRQQAAVFDRVSVQVERAASEIGEAATVGRGTLERIDDLLARGEIDSIMVNVQRASRSVDELASRLGETRGEVSAVLQRADTTLQAMGRIASRIERGEGALGRLFMDEGLADRAEGAVFQLEQLLQDIKANPGRYIRLSIF